MTLLLQRVITEIEKLSDREQDALAAVILEEMLEERKWDESFAKSPGQLEKLADEALSELRAGNATPLNFQTR